MAVGPNLFHFSPLSSRNRLGSSKCTSAVARYLYKERRLSMMTLRDLPRAHELATQLEWFKTQLATIRTVRIAVVAPACILTTWLPVNLKAPVVLSEELFTVVEAQLLRDLCIGERAEPVRCAVHRKLARRRTGSCRRLAVTTTSRSPGH